MNGFHDEPSLHYENLPQRDQDLIDTVLGKDRRKINHYSHEKTVVNVPKIGLIRQKDKTKNLDLCINQLKKEEERFANVIYNLYPLKTRGVVGAAEQLEAYERALQSTRSELQSKYQLKRILENEPCGETAAVG